MKRRSDSSGPLMESLENRQLLSLTYITGEYTGSLSIKGGSTYNVVFLITGEDRKGYLDGTVDVYTSKTHYEALAFTGRIGGDSVSFAVPGEKTDLAGTLDPSTGTITGTGKETSGGGSGTFSIKYYRRIK